MDSFKGNTYTDIQPNDVNVPITFRLPPASASTKNDGAIPNGSTVVSAAITAKYIPTNTATTSLASTHVVSGNAVTVYLSYSTTLTNGLYGITATVTYSLSGSTLQAVQEFDYNRVYVRDI